MPLIEFRCKECSSEFEILVGVSEDSEKKVCPSCGGRRLEKLLSSFSAGSASKSETGPCGISECAASPGSGVCGMNTPCSLMGRN